MSEESKCLGHTEIYIENGKVFTFVDGEKMPDYTSIRAKLVYQKLLAEGYLPIKKLNYDILYSILFYDEVVTKELLVQENINLDDDFDMSDSDYNYTYLDTLLKKYEKLRITIDEKLIEDILQSYTIIYIEKEFEDYE